MCPGLYSHIGKKARGNQSGMAVVIPPGRRLVEVFSVRINNIDGEDTGDLYGTISVADGLGPQYIYNRGREDTETIRSRPGTALLLLTGPTRSIRESGAFTIDVALMDRARDIEVSRGCIWWNTYNVNNVHDMPLTRDIKGTHGSVTVNYVVWRSAVQVTIEVTLIADRDGGKPADADADADGVYGELTARSRNFENETLLFRKAHDEAINVRPGGLVPLSRSVVAVPLNSSLVIRADLMGSAGDEIAKGTADFPTQLGGSGASEKDISGRIRVKVTWDPIESRPITD